MSLFACLLLFVLRCLNRLGRLLYFMNIDTFCIFRGLLQLALRYGSRSIVEGRYVTCRSLNFVCFWCMTVSLTIIPHLQILYIYETLRNVSFPSNVSNSPKRVRFDVTVCPNVSTLRIRRNVSIVLNSLNFNKISKIFNEKCQCHSSHKIPPTVYQERFLL